MHINLTGSEGGREGKKLEVWDLGRAATPRKKYRPPPKETGGGAEGKSDTQKSGASQFPVSLSEREGKLKIVRETYELEDKKKNCNRRKKELRRGGGRWWKRAEACANSKGGTHHTSTRFAESNLRPERGGGGSHDKKKEKNRP